MDLESAARSRRTKRIRRREKTENRRYQDAVLGLTQAFALAAASDHAKAIRDEVGFFQAIRAALVKSDVSSSRGYNPQKEMAVRQIVSRAVVSTEIVDIMKAAGLKSPDISILSDEFLAEVQQMQRKNLALEALKKLLNDQIQSRSKTNVVETKAFSKRLEEAVARYHNNAISTVEVLQELIGLAKDLRAASQRGKDQGLSDDEIAFYDALAENESAVQIMGNDHLKLIAHELLASLQQNITVDWAQREPARARLRVLVKKILKRYGYPPDLQDAAVQTVLQQAEVWSTGWTDASKPMQKPTSIPDWLSAAIEQLDLAISSRAEHPEEDDSEVPQAIVVRVKQFLDELNNAFGSGSDVPRPYVGASYNGHIVVGWIAGSNRLDIEFYENGQVQAVALMNKIQESIKTDPISIAASLRKLSS